MPALTPADTTILPRVDPAEGEPTRPVLEIADAPSFLEGEGFKVRRATAGIHPVSYTHLTLPTIYSV